MDQSQQQLGEIIDIWLYSVGFFEFLSINLSYALKYLRHNYTRKNLYGSFKKLSGELSVIHFHWLYRKLYDIKFQDYNTSDGYN